MRRERERVKEALDEVYGELLEELELLDSDDEENPPSPKRRREEEARIELDDEALDMFEEDEDDEDDDLTRQQPILGLLLSFLFSSFFPSSQACSLSTPLSPAPRSSTPASSSPLTSSSAFATSTASSSPTPTRGAALTRPDSLPCSWPTGATFSSPVHLLSSPPVASGSSPSSLYLSLSSLDPSLCCRGPAHPRAIALRINCIKGTTLRSNCILSRTTLTQQHLDDFPELRPFFHVRSFPDISPSPFPLY